jgi:hypothetical protein
MLEACFDEGTALRLEQENGKREEGRSCVLGTCTWDASCLRNLTSPSEFGAGLLQIDSAIHASDSQRTFQPRGAHSFLIYPGGSQMHQ